MGWVLVPIFLIQKSKFADPFLLVDVAATHLSQASVGCPGMHQPVVVES